MLVLDTTAPRFWRQLEAFCAGARPDAALVKNVAAILEDVRRGGDAAVRRYTRKFDGVDVPPARLRVSAQELAAAKKN